MDLQNFYFVTNSISSILITIFLFVLIAILVSLYIKVSKLADKIDKVADNGIETSRDIKEFVHKTLESIDHFRQNILTFDSVRRITGEVMQAIKKHPKQEEESVADLVSKETK